MPAPLPGTAGSRLAVLWRTGCFGTQRAAGSRFVDRRLSVVATGRQQSKDVATFLRDAVTASRFHQSRPPLFSEIRTLTRRWYPSFDQPVEPEVQIA